ncbi:androgen-dependent TFPI-regulating protein-like isoform X2 [Trichoplusia ni]|uniref:Androgen-dependent TFPI-regulating protein-like isoform X2 n=1 Tax=Trichoplusia ni TaxID=7111 RepID=A0A7E5WMY7_TRINI|nr:androgen-dependent TFPI-regulating protein-like isoform X2 [Trichoplusia ni]
MSEVKITIGGGYSVKRSLRFYVRFFIHFCCWAVFTCVFAFGGYLWFKLIREDVKAQALLDVKWYTPCYLTNWNFMFQTIFLTMSLAYDMLEWFDRHDTALGRKLKFCRDVMFSGLVVPLTLFISSMFWTLFWIDRELVFPEVYDQLVPWWFNHCVHTNIAIVVLIETLMVSRRHPTHFKLELFMNGTAGVLYAIVYYSIYFFANRWLYGVFGIMTWWQVCLYQILIWTSTFVFYFIQFPINRIFHREESNEQKYMVTEVKKGIPNAGFKEEDSWIKHRTKRTENSSF